MLKVRLGRKIQSQLVSEATMVSRELMRVAMTPHEVWHDGLEAAAQQYLELKDVNAMASGSVATDDTHGGRLLLGRRRKAQLPVGNSMSLNV
jgi:hypothetical protein